MCLEFIFAVTENLTVNMNSKPFITEINGYSEDKFLKKVLLTISFSVLSGYVGYSIYKEYNNILKKNKQIKYIQDIKLKFYNRKKHDTFEVRKCYFILSS